MPKSRYIRCNDIKEGYYEPKEYQPISVWGYIGYELLFSIPVIGWIVCIVKTIGSKNKNVRNFARAQVVVVIVYVALIVACKLLGINIS